MYTYTVVIEALLACKVFLRCKIPSRSTAPACRYPHLSCELLTCDVEAIINCLSESETLMGMLWAFLDREEAINPLLGRWVISVVLYFHVFLRKYPTKTLATVWWTQSDSENQLCIYLFNCAVFLFSLHSFTSTVLNMLLNHKCSVVSLQTKLFCTVL